MPRLHPNGISRPCRNQHGVDFDALWLDADDVVLQALRVPCRSRRERGGMAYKALRPGRLALIRLVGQFRSRLVARSYFFFLPSDAQVLVAVLSTVAISIVTVTVAPAESFCCPRANRILISPRQQVVRVPRVRGSGGARVLPLVSRWMENVTSVHGLLASRTRALTFMRCF